MTTQERQQSVVRGFRAPKTARTKPELYVARHRRRTLWDRLFRRNPDD